MITLSNAKNIVIDMNLSCCVISINIICGFSVVVVNFNFVYIISINTKKLQKNYKRFQPSNNNFVKAFKLTLNYH